MFQSATGSHQRMRFHNTTIGSPQLHGTVVGFDFTTGVIKVLFDVQPQANAAPFIMTPLPTGGTLLYTDQSGAQWQAVN